MPAPVSPAAAYQEALRPLTVTRASVANWSPTEQAALKVTIAQARQACELRAAKDYRGEALVDLGRLCSMGQDFGFSVQAIDAFLIQALAAAPTTPPRLGEAYAIKLDAQLRLKDEQKAFTTAREMLDRAPFGTAVRDGAAEAINYMQLLFTSDAVALAQRRQPKLLDQISLINSASAFAEENVDTATATLSDLFAQALVLPELQQLAGDLPAAASSIKALEAAVPESATSDEVVAMAGWRRRYAQLGKPLGTLDPQRTLTIPPRMPQIPAPRAITALLLFPDWCAQCVRLATQIPESVFSVEQHEAYRYGLLVETVPPAKKKVPATPRGAAAYDPADAAADLKGTSSIVVGAATLTRFNAIEVPLLIVADGNGVVRFVSPIDETALQPGNTVDSAVARVGSQWPLSGAAVPTALHPSATKAYGTSQPR